MKFLSRMLLGSLAFSATLAMAAPQVQELLLPARNGLEKETLVFYPSETKTEPMALVIMNHGFLMNKSFYRGILSEIAAQGFVVVAPQTHGAGGLPIGKPSTEKEALSTVAILNWLQSNAASKIPQAIDYTKIAFINHSRGGKVAWTLMKKGLIQPLAIAAMDPVDGTQDGTSLSTVGIKVSAPTLLIGSGLGGKSGFGGQACAPTNVNYNQFWNTVNASPSWLFVTKDYGHMDMLDDNSGCGLTCSVCAKASAEFSKDDLRQWMAATMGSFLKATVYGDSASLEAIEANSQNLNLSVERK